MKILLFGATGYLGSHVAEQLILGGHDVTCCVRDGADTAFLHTIPASIQTVNFAQSNTIAPLIDADTTVVNCIADTRPHASYQQRQGVEIELTHTLFTLAQQQQAKRFIQLSTVMMYGFDRPAHAINEAHPPSAGYIYNHIAADREKTLLDAYQNNRQSHTELMILRPSNALGKRDTSFLPNFVNANKFGMFPVVDGGHWQFSCIDARDIGRAIHHLTSIEIEDAEVYLVKGYDLDWLSLKASLDEYLGKSTRAFNMPKCIMSKMAQLFEWITPYGKNPPMTRFDLDVLSTHTLFDDSKIRATGFTPRFTLNDSIHSTLES